MKSSTSKLFCFKLCKLICRENIIQPFRERKDVVDMSLTAKIKKKGYEYSSPGFESMIIFHVFSQQKLISCCIVEKTQQNIFMTALI